MTSKANRIFSLFNRIRLWGIKGIWDYLLRQIAYHNQSRRLLDNAKRYPLVPKQGISIIADMTIQSSLSKVMRDLAFALKRAGIPFQVLDLNSKNKIPCADVASILTPPNEFRILKYDHVIEMFSSPLPRKLPLKRATVVFWEFTTGLLEYNPAISDTETIIAMSDFNFDVFRHIMPKQVKVKKILYPFFFSANRSWNRDIIRRKYGIPPNAFVVFFNFDYGSSFNRKNPNGSIKAFAKAFQNVDDAVLVFKTKGADKHQLERQKLIELAQQFGISNRMVMIDDYIPQDDVYGLTDACDVYLSLHRGEGFGLGIVEAMSLGKPVVVTNYSSTTEFCHQETSMPVTCSLVKVPDGMHDHPCYHAVKEWAEPDLVAASAALRKLYDNPPLRTQIGSAAKTFVENYFSVENFQKSIRAFMQDDTCR